MSATVPADALAVIPVTTSPGQIALTRTLVAPVGDRRPAGEPEHGGLAALVRDRSLQPDEGRHGGDVHDRAAAARGHAGDHRAHAEEDPPLVDGGDEVPLAIVGLDAGRPHLHPGVVDQDVDRAVRPLDVGDHLAPALGVGDVMAVEGRLAAERSDLLGERRARVLARCP